MQRYLILWTCAVAISAYAGLTSWAAAPSRPVPNVKQDVPPRHLSDAERAELRRQLEQFNRNHGKRA